MPRKRTLIYLLPCSIVCINRLIKLSVSVFPIVKSAGNVYKPLNGYFSVAIHEDLHEGEKIVLETHPHRWVYAAWYAVGVVLMLSLYGIVIGIPYLAFGAFLGLLVIILAGLLRRADKYYVTDKRVIHEYRLITRKVSSAFYSKIQDLKFTQNLIERVLGIGTVHINTAGGAEVEISFKGITPHVKRVIEEHMGKHHVQH